MAGTDVIQPDPARAARRRVSRHGAAALVALLAPATGFPLALVAIRGRPGFEWVGQPSRYPWELWAIAACGTAATVGGVVDWAIHRSGTTSVGRGEHRAHLAALAGGGLPLFGLMAVASVVERPGQWLVPILVVAMVTVVLICHDEYRYHRRCGWTETLTHRLLTIGNGLAWLAWVHWCFVARGGPHG